MKYLRKNPVIAAAVALVIALSGCGAGTEDQGIHNVAMGRYVETQWELPIEFDYIPGFALCPDGRIGVVLINEGKQHFYTTSDGSDWQEEVPGWLDEIGEAGRSVRDLYFAPGGEGVVLHDGMTDDGEDYTYEVALIHTDGSLEYTQIGKVPKPENSDARNVILRDALEGNDGVQGGGILEIELQEDDGFDTATVQNESSASEAEAPEPGDGSEDEHGTDETKEWGDGEAPGEEEDEYFSDYFFASKAKLGDDGLVYVETYNSIEVYDPATGEHVRDLNGSGLALLGDKAAQLLYASKRQSETWPVTANSVVLFDQKNPDDYRMLDADMLTSFGSYFGNGADLLAGTPDGTLYVSSPSGIYRLADGGEAWEKIVDGNLTSLSLPSINTSRLLVHRDSEFLVLGHGNSNGFVLFNYAYDTDIPSRPGSELIVYTLGENRTIQQAAGMFRQINPNAVVSIHNMLEDGAAATADDAILALNTELLAGKGPDLLALDGMPVQSYLEKGVLADLSDIVNPMVEQGELLDSAAAAFSRGGACLAVPTRIGLPSLWGAGEAVQAADSLSALANYAGSNPDLRLFNDLRPASLIERLGPVSQDAWTDGDRVDAEALVQFLQAVGTLADSAGEKPALFPLGDDELRVSSERMKERVDIIEDVLAVAVEDAELLIDYSQGFRTLMEPNGALYTRFGGNMGNSSGERSELPEDQADRVFRAMSGQISGGYLPQSIIGVNAGGKQQELAMEFVKALLSKEVQDADLQDGYPVNIRSLDSGRTKMEGLYMVYAGGDNEGNYREVEMGWPSEKTINRVVDTILELDHPILINEKLIQIVQEESDAYFTGAISAEQAADAVAQRARLMLAE